MRMHLVWTCLGAVAIAVWPAFTASRAPSQPLILRARGAVAVTAVFLVLSAWLIAETQHGSALGLTERLVSGIQITWPLIVALALRGAGSGTKDQIQSFERTVALAGINGRILRPGRPVPSGESKRRTGARPQPLGGGGDYTDEPSLPARFTVSMPTRMRSIPVRNCSRSSCSRRWVLASCTEGY